MIPLFRVPRRSPNRVVGRGRFRRDYGRCAGCGTGGQATRRAWPPGSVVAALATAVLVPHDRSFGGSVGGLRVRDKKNSQLRILAIFGGIARTR